MTIWLWCQARGEPGIQGWPVAPGLSRAALCAVMLYSHGAGLHQPHSVVHISALPRGVELSPAAGHTTSVVWSWLLGILVSRICGK